MAPGMPNRNHSAAPKFDGKAISLDGFLDEVDQLATEHNLGEDKKIEWSIRYVSTEEQQLWKLLPTAQGADWAAFKKELFEFYPGSTDSGDRKFSVGNLEMLSEKQSETKITTADQFGAYYRSFMTIAMYLEAKKKIYTRELSQLFLRGFDFKFRTQIRDQLKAENPKHHTDDPYTIIQIRTAALFLLSCNHNSDSVPVSPISENVSQTIKKEHYDISNLNRPVQSGNLNVESITSEIMKLVESRIQQIERNSNLQGQNSNSGPRYRSNNCCNFCSDPEHYQPNCPHVADYIRKGLCARNNDNFITLPNGLRISPHLAAGKDIRERIDNWYKANPSSLPSVSANFIGATPTIINAGYVWTVPDTTPNDSELLQDNDVPKPTIREVEELQLMESLVASTQKKIDDARKKFGPKVTNGPTTRNMARNAPSGETPKIIEPKKTFPEQKQTQPNSTTPQFKYITPIEDSKIVNSLVERALDTPITISSRELLAVAPEVRKQIKENITTKRVSNGPNGAMIVEEVVTGIIGSETFMAGLPVRKDELIVANHTEELRAIDVELNGSFQVEGILDEGSQIIGLRKDIWEKLGLPLRSDHVMVMESANQTKDHTLGLLQDLKMTIGGYDFYVQAQVVENAPYEMLIGLPFKTLTQSNTRHFSNGDAHLTLTDPNTQAVITVPTR
ncbi:MAG: retropepsin-like aspartic protease, partial [Nitrososphaerales archaeon]